MGDAEDARVSRFEGLGTARREKLEGRPSVGMASPRRLRLTAVTPRKQPSASWEHTWCGIIVVPPSHGVIEGHFTWFGRWVELPASYWYTTTRALCWKTAWPCNPILLQPSIGAEDNALGDVQSSERAVTPLCRKPIMRALGLQHVAGRRRQLPTGCRPSLTTASW